MAKQRSMAERIVLHSIRTNVFLYDSDISPLKRSVCESLQDKGLIKLTTDDEGNDYWEMV